MTEQNSGMFTRDQYAVIQDGSRKTADVVMPLVLAAINANSVLDVGCGSGAWLAACAALGITDYQGLDGFYADNELLQIPRDHFTPCDLRQIPPLSRKYDLAMCLEVAEHLPEYAAEQLIGSLTSAALTVLFSAAVPGQDGTGHINEQWASYWAKKFAARDYLPVDLVRPRIWAREDLPFWYRQNLLVYVHKSVTVAGTAPTMLDVVHPELLIRVANRHHPRQVYGREALQILTASLRRRLLPWRR